MVDRHSYVRWVHLFISPQLSQIWLTFPGGLKAVEDVYSLDVIGQRGVGEQGAVPVDCVQGKFKG